ncbi:efflux transporter periplasmic adaptor subunit [Halioglobus sp. HI00S01]|uniref:efflux RND transporter periplasmic adaptor subunit n=1 Tax=Halioglobus sp. HI00S01 TaxID=1822214 RepID=UPI0007C29D72|nr:efflux RND transporter periplasmic adaptor subunit [Halioglobus sp. HI00S01]KZX58119.1 efflux transporter periplasmic adaptor subunit [Halioglobus sp. HI00S01]
MSRNVISAVVIAGLVGLWMAAGTFTVEETATAQAFNPILAGSTVPAGELSRVRVNVIAAEFRARNVVLRGKTEAKRMVDVKAEVAGGVVARPVERGMKVAAGDLLCELALDDRGVAVQEAQAALETARIELQGSRKLRDDGLLSEVATADAQARKESALAHLHRQKLNLARTRITAPFDGVVEDLHLNVGDYAVPGETCVRLIELDPMLVRADVTESEVENLAVGQDVTGTSLAGRRIAGQLSFVGTQSDSVTRTYPVEVTVDNRDYSIRSGLTVTMSIGVEKVPAHLVASSLLSLDDTGALGLRTIDDSNRVIFSPVDILEDGFGGVWVTGLPDKVNLIIVGQEYVAPGDIVDPVFVNKSGDQVALR